MTNFAGKVVNFIKKNFVSDMTDRELIYNTLLNGIPYGIMGSVTHYDEETNKPIEVVGQIKGIRSNEYVEFYYPDGSFNLFKATDVKPYLRPMSSMTEKELWTDACKFYSKDGYGFPDNILEDKVAEYVDWLNMNHFDYRGLIEKGLALEAPEGMYSSPIQNK